MRLLVLTLALLASPLAAQTLTFDVGASGMGRAEGPFTFISLADGAVVPAADSASTAWDLAFRGTTVLVNGGASGPGEGAALLVESPFEAVTVVPEANLLADGDRDCPRGEPLAVCTGSGNGWYLYAGNGVEPLPERTLVVRTADGDGLVKLRFVSYTLQDEQPDGSRPRTYVVEVAPLSTD